MVQRKRGTPARPAALLLVLALFIALFSAFSLGLPLRAKAAMADSWDDLVAGINNLPPGTTIPLTADLTATSTLSFTIPGPITIDGDGHTITASGLSSFLLHSSGDLVLKNLTIDFADMPTGQAGLYASNDTLLLDNVTIKNKPDGFALSGYDLIINNCTFQNNNVALHYGGNLSILESLTITGSTFTGNTTGVSITSADFQGRIESTTFSGNGTDLQGNPAGAVGSLDLKDVRFSGAVSPGLYDLILNGTVVTGIPGNPAAGRGLGLSAPYQFIIGIGSIAPGSCIQFYFSGTSTPSPAGATVATKSSAVTAQEAAAFVYYDEATRMQYTGTAVGTTVVLGPGVYIPPPAQAAPAQPSADDFWLPVLAGINSGTGAVRATPGEEIDYIPHYIFQALAQTRATLTVTRGGTTFVFNGANLGKIDPLLSYRFADLIALGLGRQGGSPQTGDTAQPTLWLALAALSAAGMALVLRRQKTAKNRG